MLLLLLILFSCSFRDLATVRYPESEYEGSECGEGDGIGICTPALDCPIAERSLKQFRRHNLERCGFEGFVEIVCCPTTTDRVVTESKNPLPPVTTRKSETACKEYSNEVAPDPTWQILGGENATLGEFPHMASLGYENQEEERITWECGGSLISDRFVITAAHCIIKPDGILPVRVRLGIIDLTGSDKVEPVDFNVKNITVHKQYQPRNKTNDLALIELDGSTTKSTNVHPACLYQKNDDPLGLVITGWGHTTPGGDPSLVLQKAILRPVNVTQCSETYVNRLGRSIISSQICAVSDDGTKDTCQGDSGGPLQVQQQDGSSVYSIVGITSYGMGCGGKTPGIYTRVYSYLDWIESIVWR